MTRLWDLGKPLDRWVERLTVGRDPELDLRVVAHDALASAAHATMLERIGVLRLEELAALLRELGQIVQEAREGRFVIDPADEDCHTAIENRLTEHLGDLGRRIHTGRSRNDQIIAALRLWGRERLLDQLAALLHLITHLLELADEHRDTSIAGFTHTRQAMPSTLGFLFAGYAENLLDGVAWIQVAYRHVNRSPLGSASGFGVSLPLDRELVSDLLRFDRVQTNTLAVQNDRGKTEFLVLGAVLAPAIDIGRLAADLLWYSSDELGFLRLADEVTTDSSIMPQKRNPDILELVRAGAARLRSRHSEIAAIYGPLTSGYHRDLQLTKEPFLEGMQSFSDILAAIQPVLFSLEVDRERCRNAMQRSIGATDSVYRRLAAGEPFRTAYRDVATDPEAAVSEEPAEAWRYRTHLGAPGSMDLRPYHLQVDDAEGWLREKGALVESAWKVLEGERRET